MKRRYLKDFDVVLEDKEMYDCIIIGSGIAGMFTALSIDSGKRVLVLTKSEILNCNSCLAQGGVAAAMTLSDNPLHIEDTLKAGSRHNRESIVKMVVGSAHERIEDLVRYGVPFDRDELGNLLSTKEGGHSKRRVLHCKDYTGEAIMKSLLQVAMARDNIEFAQQTFAVDILDYEKEAVGVLVVKGQDVDIVCSRHIVIATGGIGGIFDATTNSETLTGDGISMALRANIKTYDLEFIQFHPTAYSDSNETFLISEAIRGEGGWLVNGAGSRFMKALHPLKELAPRDIVAKAMYDQMKAGDQVYLDVRHLGKPFLMTRFPTIYENCLRVGYDMAIDLVPVRPVQHYHMGGIVTNHNGETNLKGVYACGEVARTGLHGANRLASNSLLEGLVFAKNIASKINEASSNASIKGALSYQSNVAETMDVDATQQAIKCILSSSASIVRETDKINDGLNQLNQLLVQSENMKIQTQREIETINMLLAAKSILEAASKRQISLGSHIICRKENVS